MTWWSHGLRDALAFVGLALLARWQLPRARAVWRGEPATWLPMQARGLEINRRNYAVCVAGILSMGAAFAFLLLGKDTGWDVPDAIGAALAVVFLLCFFPTMSLITAFNRPRVLVPPGHRGAQGSLAADRAKRSARHAGRPETEHTIELHDVRALAEDPKPFKPYFVAICAEDGCTWLSDVLDEDAPDAEQRVRRQAMTHSARIEGPVRPLG